jgi:hypothetical protein
VGTAVNVSNESCHPLCGPLNPSGAAVTILPARTMRYVSLAVKKIMRPTSELYFSDAGNCGKCCANRGNNFHEIQKPASIAAFMRTISRDFFYRLHQPWLLTLMAFALVSFTSTVERHR